jgi:hypothetical protein
MSNTSGLFRFYEQSDCQVSNDPPVLDGQPASLNTCNITHYLCTSGGSNESGADQGYGTATVEVPYEYELLYNLKADLTGQVLPYLEETMLEHIATALRITQCVQLRRRRRAQSLADDQGRLAGVSLEPRDKLSEKYTSCTANVAVEEGDTCLPIQGGLTVIVQLTEEESTAQPALSDGEQQKIRDTVTNYLKDAMDNDIFVVPTSIDKVVFVGSSSTNETTIAQVSAQGVESWSKLHIGLIAGGGALLLLIALLLLSCCCGSCRRRRHKKQRNDREVVIDPVEETYDEDIEVGDCCLANHDSLALRHGSFDLIKLDSDNVSVNTSRTSAASVSMNQRTENDSSSDDRPSDEEQSDDEMEKNKNMTEELDFLDKLATRPPSPDASGGGSIHTEEFLHVRSTSPTTGSQITLHAGNLRLPMTGSQATMRTGNLRSQHLPSPTPLAPEATRMAYSPDSFDEEIMQIISDDDDSSEERHPDVLDGHGDYVSDSDSERLSYRSDSEENVRRHLQMT